MASTQSIFEFFSAWNPTLHIAPEIAAGQIKLEIPVTHRDQNKARRDNGVKNVRKCTLSCAANRQIPGLLDVAFYRTAAYLLRPAPPTREYAGYDAVIEKYSHRQATLVELLDDNKKITKFEATLTLRPTAGRAKAPGAQTTHAKANGAWRRAPLGAESESRKRSSQRGATLRRIRSLTLPLPE